MKKSIYVLYVSSIACGLWCYTFGAGQASLSGVRERQPINYSGTLIKVNGISYAVDDISLSGAINEIPVYKYSGTPSKSPMLDTEFINLAKVRTIQRNPLYVQASASIKAEENAKNGNNRSRRRKVRSPEALAQEGIFSYNGRDYIEIIITFINGTRDTYLIELSKEIWCNRKETDTRKEVSFEVLDRLTIERSETPRET